LRVKDLNFRIPGECNVHYPPPVRISGNVNTGFTSFRFDQSWYVWHSKHRDSACCGPGAWHVWQFSIPGTSTSLVSVLLNAFA
jgi:hypothetical protein